MDPKIAEIWDGAIDGLAKAEQRLKMGESELAKSQAQNATTSGQVLFHRRDSKVLAYIPC